MKITFFNLEFPKLDFEVIIYLYLGELGVFCPSKLNHFVTAYNL